MRRLFASVCGIVLLASLTACADPWPAERPERFTVTYSWTAGMLPHYRNLRIVGLMGTYTAARNRQRTTMAFTLTKDEADRLYAVFKSNRFDRIESRIEKVHDRGGLSITVSWPGTVLDRSDAGRSFVKKAYHADWRAVRDHLDRLISKVKKRKSNGGATQ